MLQVWGGRGSKRIGNLVASIEHITAQLAKLTETYLDLSNVSSTCCAVQQCV